MTSPSGPAQWRATERLLALLSAGDFDGADSRRLTAALGPYALLLRAVVRLERDERATARADVDAAIALAPRNGLVRFVASRLFHVLRAYRCALAESAVATDLGVSAAALLRYEQARKIGWYHEARAVLEALLRTSAAPPASASAAEAAAGKPHERALGHLLQLYFEVHHYEAAARLVDDFFPALHASPRLSLQAARVYERREQPDKALAAIRNAVAADGSPPVCLQAAKLLLEIGAFEEARSLYEQMLQRDSGSMPALEALGRLCLWRGDLAAACRYADDLDALAARNLTARRIRAAVRVLDGDCAGAIPELDAVLNDDPHDAEAHVWRAEARLRLGRFEDAQADCDRSGYSFVGRVIRLLATLQRGRARADSAGARVRAAADVLGRPLSRAVASVALGRARTRRWWRRTEINAEARLSPAPEQDADSPPPGRPIAVPLWQELSAELGAIDADASALFARGRSDDLIDLLDRALRAMRGNRTTLATRVRDDGSLTLLPRSVSARAASRYAMELIKIASPEEALAGLDALAQRFPDSAMPLVHRGELHLWLGRYADARTDLQAAIAIQRHTRWAWYGLACLDLVDGDPERALATCAEGIRVMHNTEGPVAFLYRGEAYRCLGRLDEARDQLVRSCELHPTRLSAWINLALVHGAAADTLRQRDVFARIARTAPALLSEATQELGDDVFTAIVLGGRPADAPESGEHVDGARLDRVLRHCLGMMRGNRSSSCVTYLTADGAVHYIPQRHDGAPLVEPAAEARELAEIRQLVLRALQSR